mgnify:CR=1 FL=1
MTCIICKVELKEETVEGMVMWHCEGREFPSKQLVPTGYHYCPQCGLVYKEKV